MQFEIPIRTVSEANCSQHWAVCAKRHKTQQYFTKLALQQYVPKPKLPCIVTLSRIAPRLLDDDNLPVSLKYIRDEISEYFIPEKTGFYMTKKGIIKPKKGHADRDNRITWHYFQEYNKIYAVRIEIEF